MYRYAVSLVVCASLHSNAAFAQVPHIVGSWVLNWELSDYPGVMPRTEVRTYVPLDDGVLMGTVVTIDAEGNARFLQFAARPDGQDYPEYDPIALARLQTTGQESPASYSERALDERTVEWTDKFNGEVYARGTRRVSDDGLSMIIEFETRGRGGEWQEYTAVYDRQ